MLNYTPQIGDYFIDAAAGYDKSELMLLLPPEQDGGDARIFSFRNPSQPLSGFAGDFLPSFDHTPARNDELQALKEIHDQIRDSMLKRLVKFEDFLQVETYLAKEHGVSIQNVSAALKLLTANNFLHFKEGKLGLSDGTRAREDRRKFFGSIIEEIESKSRRISLIIAHDSTAGDYREILLRSVLTRYLPHKYHVATGFISLIF